MNVSLNPGRGRRVEDRGNREWITAVFRQLPQSRRSETIRFERHQSRGFNLHFSHGTQSSIHQESQQADAVQPDSFGPLLQWGLPDERLYGIEE